MAIELITQTEINENGVCSAPDSLTGTAEENKSVFDKLSRNVIIPRLNALIEASKSSGNYMSVSELPDPSERTAGNFYLCNGVLYFCEKNGDGLYNWAVQSENFTFIGIDDDVNECMFNYMGKHNFVYYGDGRPANAPKSGHFLLTVENVYGAAALTFQTAYYADAFYRRVFSELTDVWSPWERICTDRDAGGKAEGTYGNLAAIGSGGNLIDSGVKAESLAGKGVKWDGFNMVDHVSFATQDGSDAEGRIYRVYCEDNAVYDFYRVYAAEFIGTECNEGDSVSTLYFNNKRSASGLLNDYGCFEEDDISSYEDLMVFTDGISNAYLRLRTVYMEEYGAETLSIVTDSEEIFIYSTEDVYIDGTEYSKGWQESFVDENGDVAVDILNGYTVTVGGLRRLISNGTPWEVVYLSERAVWQNELNATFSMYCPKLSPVSEGNIPVIDEEGGIRDSGVALSDVASPSYTAVLATNTLPSTAVWNTCTGQSPFNKYIDVTLSPSVPLTENSVYSVSVGTPLQQSRYGIVAAEAEGTRYLRVRLYAVETPGEALALTLTCFNVGV